MPWHAWLPIAGCSINLLTLLICYGLSYRHPKLNQERYIFTLSSFTHEELSQIIFLTGITLSGFMYLLTTLVRHHLLRRTLCFLERENMMLLKRVRYLQLLNIASSLFGCLGAIISCLVALILYVPKDHQDIFILAPYGGYVACMWLNTLLSYAMKRRRIFFYFLILSICSMICLVVAVTFVMNEKRVMKEIGAVASYVLIIGHAKFMSLFFHDFRNSNFVVMDSIIPPSPPGARKYVSNA